MSDVPKTTCRQFLKGKNTSNFDESFIKNYDKNSNKTKDTYLK